MLDQADQGVFDVFFNCVAVREFQDDSARLAIRVKFSYLLTCQGNYGGN